MRLNVLLATVLALPAVAAEPAGRVEVVAVGEMRTVMQKGDLSATIDLRTLADLKHLYALGPVEGLKGEVTVWDGRPSIARVVDGEVRTSGRYDVKACFLVYAQVRSWHEVSIPDEVRDAGQLEAFVAGAARRVGVDPGRPFPFAVKGTFAKVAFHVVNKTDDEPHSRQTHDKVKVHFTAERVAAKLVGFYSDRHHGVFTHHGTNVHVHVITDDGKRSGHVESLRLGPGSVLLLPRS